MARCRNTGETEGQPGQSAPFSIRPLELTDNRDSPVPPLDIDQPLPLFPASYPTQSNDLVAPPSHDVWPCIRSELDLQRLNKVHGLLWFTGRLLPPRALHHQLLLGREIFVTEQMDMHLVWTTGRIFVKPMPRFLLEPCFWTEYLCCGQACGCSDGETHSERSTQECERRKLRKYALGFLFSYAALIRHESDFLTAKDKHLLPGVIKWSSWVTFIEQLDTEHIYPDIDPRFFHGELRLSRLNLIWRLSQNTLEGYTAHWQQYTTFFQDNFSWLAGTTVYIAVVLTAMQVGLATDALAHDDAFQSASYGFTIFSILGPLICAGLIVQVFCFMFIYNWVMTLRWRNSRLRHILRRHGQ